jgi:hypothetical protein
MDRERGLLARLADPPADALPERWRCRERFEGVGPTPLPHPGFTTFFYAPDDSSAPTPIAAIEAGEAFVLAAVAPHGLMSEEDVAGFAAASGLDVMVLSTEDVAVGFAWPATVDRSLVDSFVRAIA